MVEGGQDSYNHFLISKYAFQHPELLIDQWGKPVYTFIAHPFCKLGLSYAVLFNIFCTLFAAIFAALSSKALGFRLWLLAFWICIFAPIALGNTLSSLTEPLNMLALSGAFYLYLKNKKWGAVLVFSLMPWIRTEGFVILVPFITFLIIQKEYKLIPWIFTTTLLLNLVGWMMTGKPFWFITENPYVLVELEADRFAPEGGSFAYYLQNNKNVFGNVFLILGVIGALKIAIDFYRKKKENISFAFWVILGVFVAYFFAHSFIMWKGMMGTHGMLRVMMVIVPSLAIAASASLEWISKYHWSKYLQPFLWIAIAIGTFHSYKANGYPTKFWNLNSPSVKQLSIVPIIEEAHQYIVEQGLDTAVIYHQLPIYNVLYDKNPFPEPLKPAWETEDVWSIDLKNNWAPAGSILLWDDYHATREGGITEEQLSQLKNYQKLQTFGGDSRPKLILFYKVQ